MTSYPILGSIQKYLNRKDVMVVSHLSNLIRQDALGAEVSNYESCNMDINRKYFLSPSERI
jgi:hypothetical protein